MTLGERIKELRKKNDLTQEKLADDIRSMFGKRKHFSPLWGREQEIFG